MGGKPSFAASTTNVSFETRESTGGTPTRVRRHSSVPGADPIQVFGERFDCPGHFVALSPRPDLYLHRVTVAGIIPKIEPAKIGNPVIWWKIVVLAVRYCWRETRRRRTSRAAPGA